MQKSHLSNKMIHYGMIFQSYAIGQLLVSCKCHDAFLVKWRASTWKKGVETSQAITDVGHTIESCTDVVFTCLQSRYHLLETPCYGKKLSLVFESKIKNEETKKILKKTYILWQKSFVKNLKNVQNIYYSSSVFCCALGQLSSHNYKTNTYF